MRSPLASSERHGIVIMFFQNCSDGFGMSKVVYMRLRPRMMVVSCIISQGSSILSFII